MISKITLQNYSTQRCYSKPKQKPQASAVGFGAKKISPELIENNLESMTHSIIKNLYVEETETKWLKLFPAYSFQLNKGHEQDAEKLSNLISNEDGFMPVSTVVKKVEENGITKMQAKSYFPNQKGDKDYVIQQKSIDWDDKNAPQNLKSLIDGSEDDEVYIAPIED